MAYPIFARPRSVIPLPDQGAFIALLDEFNVPYRSWKAETLEKRWREIARGDAVYTTTYDFLGARAFREALRPNMPLRFIITVAARVSLVQDDVTYVLVERSFNPDTNAYDPRKYDGSMSEKSLLDPMTGRPVESRARTLVRALAEEAQITGISECALKRGLIFKPYDQYRLIGRARHVEQDSREKEDTPGIWNFNQVAHYNAQLPSSAYFPSFRRDAGTHYLSRWVSTVEEAMLEPIPAELVFNVQ